MPRIPMFSAELRVANGVTRSEGMAPSAKLPSEIALRSLSIPASTTLTEIGVCCRLVARFCAVTTTWSSATTSAVASAVVSAGRVVSANASEGSSAAIERASTCGRRATRERERRMGSGRVKGGQAGAVCAAPMTNE